MGAATWAGMTARERHLALVLAVVAVGRDPVVSHASAALLWDLPLVGWRDERVHLTIATSSGGRSRGDVVRHAVRELPETTVRQGVVLTTPARTVIDVARVGGLVAGLVAADAAVSVGLTDRAALEREAARVGAARGSRVARLVASAVDGRSESPGESLSRARILEHGLEPPVLQHEIGDTRGPVGRVDFWWPGAKVVGEFDGRSKYGSAANGADELWREKRREDRLRAIVAGVVRWTWDDAWRGAPMIDLLRRAGVR